MVFENVLTFIGFFFAGLAVNLTPCVYPMLTVTTSLFKPKKDVQETLGNSFIKALCYVLGMAVMYSALGYFAASTGKLFGVALQNNWVLGAVAVMMFALGLSMLGFYQISVPSGVLTRLSALRKASYIGLFVSGMLVGVFAAPCIGPPVLALLAAVASNGNPSYGLLAFFVFSLGLGLPYLLLGTFSSLISKLPKAGSWLIWIERTFGVILLGFGIFYLSLALHLNTGVSPKESAWQAYTPQRWEELLKEHKPIIMDFFADWCIGCHELDREVFSRQEVRTMLSQVNALRVDATNIDAPEVSRLLEKYGIVGLPTVLFLDAQGHEIKEIRVEGSVSLHEFNRSFDEWLKMTKAVDHN